MDEELNSFQKSWHERRAAMLERHQEEQSQGLRSLPAVEEP